MVYAGHSAQRVGHVANATGARHPAHGQFSPLAQSLLSLLSNRCRHFAYASDPSTKMGLCQTKSVLLAACVLAITPPVDAQEKPGPADAAALPGREVAAGVRLLGHLGHPRLNESSGV